MDKSQAQAQSGASEDQVRAALVAALVAQGGRVVMDVPGRLEMEVGGTVGTAYLAGGFRNKMKMPMSVVVVTNAGPGGTGLAIDVDSRGTAGGFMSGGILGAVKQRKAADAWLQIALGAVPQRVS